MKITKLVHSCLLVEEDGKAVLIDPGIFSWSSGLLNVEALPKLDSVLITHLHPDHCYPEFIKALLNKFGNIPVISNQDVATTLKTEGITVTDEVPAFISSKTIQHADLWFDLPPPQNTIFTLFDRLTHVGDTHEFSEAGEVLALPVQAPWGSFKDALEQVKKTKPKKVIPIHDWWLSAEGKQWFYDRAEEGLSKIGIEFISLKDGEPIEL